MTKQELLIKYLLESKVTTKDVLDKVRKEASKQKKSFESILIKRQVIDSEEIVKAKAKIYGMDYKSLFDEKIDEVALNIIPNELSQTYKAICFAQVDKSIKVGIVDPENFKAQEAIDFLAKKHKLQPTYCLISEASFSHAFKGYQSMSQEVVSALKIKEEEEKELIEIKEKDVASEELEEVVKSAPVTKIVSVIIRHAVDGNASDIHIEPMLRETRVRYRIDGILHTSLVLPKNIHYAIVARIKVLAGLKLDETRIPQGGRIRLLINDKEIDFRVSIIPLVDTEKVVMRILDVTKGAPTLEELGFDSRNSKLIKKHTKRTYGIFLITGPTGSGKSTTLFSILNIINREDINISTLEDPVEYYVGGVNQSQIRPRLGFTFAAGLRNLLRQDPDVMMVGEIRDNETAELSIHAALTGHLVFSTLHTNNAVGAIPRLIDMKAERFLLSSVINAVVAQRLVRKVCKSCRVEDKEVPADILEDITKELSGIPESDLKKRVKGYNADKVKFYKGEGCPRCGSAGYAGRMAIVEIIDINPELREMISSRKKVITPEDVLETQNFLTIRQDGIIKALQGKTTIEEIMRVVQE